MSQGTRSATFRPALPEYAHPPIVAATLGVHFDDVEAIPPALLSEYQKQLGPEWIGKWSEASATATNPHIDTGLVAQGFELKNVLNDRVLRVSPQHLAFTWLGTEDGRYPRYENLRDGFVAAWDLWGELLPAAKESNKRWAVSYLNRIPQGTVWQRATDWSFCNLLAVSPRSIIERMMSARWQFQVPEVEEGLVAEWWLESLGTETSTSSIWLRLLAEGIVNHESSSPLDGMDAGRSAIVRTFSDLMSPAANAYWGLRRRET